MVCYLCGEELTVEGEVNIDHIPPSGFFQQKNPPGIKKLKTHKKCNSAFQFDEEYIVNLISIVSAGWSTSAQKIWGQKRLKSVTHPANRKFLSRLMRETTRAKDVLPDIPETLNSFPATKINQGRLENVLVKIVRALYFEEFDKTVESDCLVAKLEGAFQWARISSTDKFSIGTPGAEEFCYSISRGHDGLVYQLSFYDNHLFVISLRRRI